VDSYPNHLNGNGEGGSKVAVQSAQSCRRGSRLYFENYRICAKQETPSWTSLL
jgi:hypothetical protein